MEIILKIGRKQIFKKNWRESDLVTSQNGVLYLDGGELFRQVELVVADVELVAVVVLGRGRGGFLFNDGDDASPRER